MGAQWRTLSNDFGPEKGLDDGDVETFKKEPEESLARETGQNSIDANNGVKPTRIEYKTFEVERNCIPGIDELTAQIRDCYEYKKDLPKEEVPLKKMLARSKDSKITCLRVSDFNTKGLEGVKTNAEDKAFYLLTKGSGISYKGTGSGGSKGIGKYASFVNSNINTVFYSTYNKDEERGYIGVAKLRSAPIPGKGKLKTQGISYYCANEEKEPILKELNLDPSFKREDGNYGTDLYIVGFKSSSDWKWSIISKLLESFMVAIIEGSLVVEVDDIEVSADTLGSLIRDKGLQRVCNKRLYRDIQAQYDLLTEEGVFREKLDLGELGNVAIYVKKYDANHSDMATQKCVLIRYPYMKIKVTDRISKIPFSAMCIIEDNELNQLLRNVENPQHTDWEFNRLNDDKPLKKKTKDAERKLREAIKEYVNSVMFVDTSEETDVYGAGEFLPSQELGEAEVQASAVKKDIFHTTKVRKNTMASPKKEKTSEGNDTFEHSVGQLTDDGDDAKKEGGAGGGGDNPYDDPVQQGGNGLNPGKDPVLKKVSISGIKYKNIVVNEDEGKYDLKFVAPHDEKIFELELKMCGDANDTYALNFESASIDGNPCSIENGKIKMSLEKGKSYKISYTTDQKESFSSEVVMNAYR